MGVYLIRGKLDGRKLWLVGGVRKVLGLQTECGPVSVCFALFTGYISIEEITRIKLNAGLIGKYLQKTPALRFKDGCGKGCILIC